MPRSSQHLKAETFNFRIDPDLKAAFTHAVEAEDKPAAQVLRDFMRSYVERQKQNALLLEARRQSLAIAKRSQDPNSDDDVSLKELDALFDEVSIESDEKE